MFLRFPLAIAAGSPSEKVGVTQPDTILETLPVQTIPKAFLIQRIRWWCVNGFSWAYVFLRWPAILPFVLSFKCRSLKFVGRTLVSRNAGCEKIQTSHRNLGCFLDDTGTLWTCGWFSISQSTFPAAYSSLLVWPSLPFQGFLFSFHFISRYRYIRNMCLHVDSLKR